MRISLMMLMLTLTACGQSLSQFDPKSLEVHCLLADDVWAGACPKALNGRAAIFLVRKDVTSDGQCALGPVVASLNGVALKQVDPGTEYEVSGCDSRASQCRRCTSPAWEFDALDAGAPARFEVKDGERTIAASFINAFEPRVVTLASPGEPHAGNGQLVSVRWSPSTDTCERPDLLFYSSQALKPPTGAYPKGSLQIWSATWSAAEATMSTQAIVDADAVRGPGLLVARATCFAKVEECSGISSCLMEVGASPTSGNRPEISFSLD